MLALAGCVDDSERRTVALPADGPDYWPTEAWQTATPESKGFSAGAFDTLAADAATALPYHTSLLVIRDGYIVHESYHTPEGESTTVTADTKHHVWSVTKSVTSLVLGTAWTRGDLLPGDLDTATGDSFPDVIADLDADDTRRDITLRDALEMRSGLYWNDAWVISVASPMLFPDPDCPGNDDVTLCSVLHRDQTWAPGTVWNYSTFDSYLIGAFFLELTDSSLRDYAAANLFAPMNIGYVSGDWTNWPTGSDYTFGGGLLQLTARDMAKIGFLMLQDGRWEDEQLLAPEWFELSTAPQGTGLIATFDGSGAPVGSTAFDIPYGFQWWRVTGPDLGGLPSLSARGLGGQLIHVFPEQDLIVVVTCDAALADDETTTELQSFIAAEILAALP